MLNKLLMFTPFSGCMAPEYPYKDEISVKSDIYRLGLLLIQITTREKIFPKEEDPSAREYIDKVRRNIT